MTPYQPPRQAPYQPPRQAPQWGPRPPPQKSNGWLIALAIVGGIFVLGAVGVGIAVYAIVQSDVGQTTIKAVGAAKHLADKAANAPGAAEIRAAGCESAMIIEPGDMDEFLVLFDAGIPDSGKPGVTMITCQTRRAPPSCDALAMTYASALGGHAPNEFVVSVQQQGNNTPLCQNTYDPAGGLIGPGFR